MKLKNYEDRKSLFSVLFVVIASFAFVAKTNADILVISTMPTAYDDSEKTPLPLTAITKVTIYRTTGTVTESFDILGASAPVVEYLDKTANRCKTISYSVSATTTKEGAKFAPPVVLPPDFSKCLLAPMAPTGLKVTVTAP